MIRNRGNRVFALRHATSIANEQRLIISKPITGCKAYGLSASGNTALVSKLASYAELVGKSVVIVSSDFLRTKQTAELLATELGVEPRLSERLRERFFGDFEEQPNSNYQQVWERDGKGIGSTQWNVESVDSVAERMLAELNLSNDLVQNQSIILVSHGDPLQILETALLGLPLSTHRDRMPLGPGELRQLKINERF